MPVAKLVEYLDRHGVRYSMVRHSPAFTAQEIAASAHIPGQEVAKTVIVELDGQMAMAVVPASYQLDLGKLKRFTGADEVRLATEVEFKSKFPGCEPGAMPPFGNLYDMEVFASDTLAEDVEIAFNAGSHTELLRMEYADFDRLVHPKVGRFSVHA